MRASPLWPRTYSQEPSFGAPGFRTEAGGVVEELFDSDFCFARIAEGLGPGNELESRIFEGHFFGSVSALA